MSTNPTKERLLTPCVEWTKSRFWQGYGQRWCPKSKEVKYAHRMAWEEVNGLIPDGLYVLHKCDNPPCVNVDHLYLGTQKDNMRDRKERGREADVRGEKNPHCKLSNAEVAEIRQWYGIGAMQVELAGLFGVTQGYVSKIVRGENRAS